MADIISLDKKLNLAKEKKATVLQKRKVLTIQKIFQCTQCAFKCVKCGAQVDQDDNDAKKGTRIPYNFCVSCSEEYLDYIERLKGRGDPDCYWHNDAWLEMWRSWIEYQGTVDSYLKSKEFLRILQELKQPKSDK